ncbi:hypothetical protein LCGC14_3098420, partial [marine sediment metagenome]
RWMWTAGSGRRGIALVVSTGNGAIPVNGRIVSLAQRRGGTRIEWASRGNQGEGPALLHEPVARGTLLIHAGVFPVGWPFKSALRHRR